MAMNITRAPQVFPGQRPGVTSPQEWSTGLCACCQDPGNCIITFCCPCITVGQIAEVVDQGTTSCTAAGCIYLALACAGCPCIYSCTFRSKLRSLYSLKETPCGDCLLHCCCDLCAICQEYRELKLRGVDPSLGWSGNVTKWNNTSYTTPPNVALGMSR